MRDCDDQVARSPWRAAVALVPHGQEKDLAEELSAQLGRGDREVQLSLSRALIVLGEGVIMPVLRKAMAWLLGTHHGAVQPGQLDHYLEEFAFRFNRRASRSRGLLFYRLLEQSVQHDPVTYRDVVHPGRNRQVALHWS